MSETTTTTSSNIVRNVVDSIKDSDSLLQGLLAYFTNLEPIHYITFTINLLILIFGRQIINHLSVHTVDAIHSRLRLLRIINAVLFLAYFIAVAFQFQLGSNIAPRWLQVLPSWAKLAPIWPQDGPSRWQDSHKHAQVDPNMGEVGTKTNKMKLNLVSSGFRLSQIWPK